MMYACVPRHIHALQTGRPTPYQEFWTGLDWTGLDWTGTRELATEYIIRYQTTAACLFSPLVFYPRQ